VTERLHSVGWSVVAPTLTGCEPASPRIGTAVRLDEWAADTATAVEKIRGSVDHVMLVGHSQGGLVTTAARPLVGSTIDGLLHVDAPVPEDGQRGIDLNPPGVPAPPDGLDPSLWMPARPVDAATGFLDEELARWVNERLVPTPIGPSLDKVSLAGAPEVAEHFVFCTQTPTTYPCWSTRLRSDARGTPYAVIDSPHDAPLLAPDEVVAQIVGFAGSLA
jgi:pimeloyl-ACP methyl ester carboxylesterase